LLFSGLSKITDAISDVKDAVAPVTRPVGDAFNAAVDRARSTAGSAANIAADVSSVVGAALDGDGARPLSAKEEAIAREYFGDSIDYDRVQINESSALAVGNKHFPGNDSSRPFVAGNTINFPSEINLDDPIERSTFLHEVTHVWQFQSTRGIGTTIEGIQLGSQDQREVYRLDNVDIDPSNLEAFHDLNIEKQAEIVRGHFLLSEHDRLTKLESDPSLSPAELSDVRSRIARIEGHGRFKDLSDHKDSPKDASGDPIGFTASDLDPFIDEIQSTRPRDGIAAERDEAIDEIVDKVLGGNPVGAAVETVEGGLEVGREVGEAAYDQAAEVAGGARDAVENFGEEITRRIVPRPPFGF